MLNEVSQIDQSVHSDLPWGVVVYPDSTASEPVPVGDCQVGPSLLGLPADDLGDQGSIPHSHACRVELPVESDASSYTVTAVIYRGKVGPLDCPSVGPTFTCFIASPSLPRRAVRSEPGRK